MFDPADPRNELYSRPAYFKVFVSSKMAEGALAEEREAAADSIEEFPLAKAWTWERSAPGGSYYSKEECVRQAGTSDAIVLILEDELTATTRAEYAAAHAAGATAIILLKEGFARPQSLERFIARACGDAIYKPFTNLAELRSVIVGSLWTWTVRAGRTVLLKTREERAQAAGEFLYGDLELLDEDGNARYVSEVVEEARETAATGSAPEALRALYYLADVAASGGLLPVASALLDEIATTIPAAALDRAWEGWIANVRGRVESASRRPRAAQANFEQMRQLSMSIGDREMEAIAHQNLGVEASLREDHEAAREHYMRSLTLKRDLGDIYGGTAVILNLASVLTQRDRFDSAEAILDDFESLVVRHHMVDLRANVEGQRGLIASGRGELDVAKSYFLKALRWARGTGWVPRQINSLQNLGKNAGERGKLRESARWYGKALEQALTSSDKHQEQIQRMGLANAHFRLKEWQTAADQYAAAAAVAAELGDASAQAEALGDAAAALRNAGEAEAALGLIDAVLVAPAAEKEPAWRTAQLRNLAEVLVDLDQPSEALRRLREAANLSTDPRQTDAALQRGAEIALAHPGLAHEAPALLRRALAIHREEASRAEWAWQAATMGAMLSGTSQGEEAPAFFALALRVFARSHDRERAFYTRNDRAIALNLIGHSAAAAADLRSCIQVAEKIGDRALQFQAQLNLGEVERQRGRRIEARRHLERALALARKVRDQRDEAAAIAIIGLLLVDEGDTEAAALEFRRTLRTGQELRDASLKQSALGGLAGVAYRAGRNGEAERLYRRAIAQAGEAASVSLAEDLGGCLLAMAARGRFEEEIVQRLVDVSGVVGWDAPCARQLAFAAATLIEAGTAGEAIDLQIAATAVALRSLLVWIADHDDLEDLPTAAFSEVVLRGLRWMRARDDGGELKARLLDGVRAGLGLDEDPELLLGALDAAEGACQEQSEFDADDQPD
jgi:tetratricopeptide (TPR) repeat protein